RSVFGADRYGRRARQGGSSRARIVDLPHVEVGTGTLIGLHRNRVPGGHRIDGIDALNRLYRKYARGYSEETRDVERRGQRRGLLDRVQVRVQIALPRTRRHVATEDIRPDVDAVLIDPRSVVIGETALISCSRGSGRRNPEQRPARRR